MAYTLEHAAFVASQLERLATQMRDAQLGWVYAHGTLVSGYCPFCGGACEFAPTPPVAPTRIPSSKLDAARTSVKDAAYHFLRRLYRAKWIDEVRLRAACDQVGTSVDIEDLERR